VPPATDPQRVLVVADIWCQIDGLCAHVRDELDQSEADVLVVAPALAGRLHTMTSDLDTEMSEAKQRLEDVLRRLNEHGVPARGEIGDPNPAQAIEDVLAEFEAEKIVIVTETSDHENWREHALAERLQKHGLPVTHLLVAHDIAQ
jgi:nucleotide-binding universal stress UspA family protein